MSTDACAASLHCGLALLVAASLASAAPQPLLNAPLDGAMQAAWAPGEALTPAASMAGPYVAGVRGQARQLGGVNTATYYLDSHFLPPRGACSLWAAPVDWTPGSADHFVFFTSFSYTGADNAYVRVILYKLYNETDLTLLAQNTVGGEQTALCRTPIPFWRKGQWHHLAFTWDEQRYRLYVDGKAVGEAQAIALPASGRWEVRLGTPFEGWAYLGSETTAFDEFTLWAEALPAEEIKRMYEEIAPTLPAPPDEPAETSPRRENLALRRNGAFVLASSFQDFVASYPDNLIDGNPGSFWRPREAQLPQWLEVRWPVPMRLTEVALRPEIEGAVTASSAHSWDPGTMTWTKLGTGASSATFPETETDRLRVVIEQGEASRLALSGLEVYGPPQPILARLKPYWQAFYIWYPEPDEVYKPNEPRFFRQVFEVADPTLVRSAILQLRSNDHYRAWLNGTEVATGSTTITPIEVRKVLVAGRNVLAVEAELHSNPGQWGWGELIFELALNYDDRTDYVSSGAQTLSAATPEEGWAAVGHDAAKWQPAARFVSPPDGVWGEIPYHARPVGEKAALAGFRVRPERPRPGQAVTVEVTLTPETALSNDQYFVLEIGEQAALPDWDNWDLLSVPLQPDPPSSQWPPGQPHPLTFRFTLPACAPDGALPVRLKAYGVNRGGPLEVTDAAGKPVAQVGKLRVSRPARPASAPRQPRLDASTGAIALARGKERTPPIFWALRTHSWERYQLYGDTGNHVYHVHTTPLNVDDKPETLAVIQRLLEARLAGVLRVDAQAQFIVLVELRPSAAWLEANPRERLLTAQGTLGPVSYCSAAYQTTVDRFLKGLIGYLKSRPYWPRVIGYLPMSCGAPDSTMGGTEANLFQKDRTKLTVGDFNPQAVTAFREWLRVRYAGSDARLRKAWADPAVTLATATPIIGELVREGVDGGLFRDPLDSGMTLDYFDFLSRMMGRFYARVMRTIKQAAGKQALVGAYYGYTLAHLYGYNSPASQFNGNNFDLYDCLQNPDWDFFAGPLPYESRAAGEPFKSYHATASALLHGKLVINEMDHRTFMAAPTTYGRLHGPRETDAVLRRDVGGSIVDGSGHWFADWSGARGRDGVGYFTDPSTLQTVRQTTAAAARALRQPRSGAEVALLVHGGTMAAHDVYRANPLYYNLITRTVWGEMSRMGVPYDTYLLEDLADQRVRDGYKLFVLLNPFLLTAEQRRLIDDLKRDGKTLLFFYAPGYADRETGLRDANVTAVTGLRVAHAPAGEIMRYRLTDASHPVTQGLQAGKEYAVEPYGYEISRELHPPAFGPVFRVEDPSATTLGTYPDGAVALAARDFGQWKAAYCTVPYMAAEVLRGVCRWAGVHVWCDEDVVLKADNRSLMVHNGYGQPRELTIALPGEWDVVDLCDGKSVAERTRTLRLKLGEAETRLLDLSAPSGPR